MVTIKDIFNNINHCEKILNCFTNVQYDLWYCQRIFKIRIMTFLIATVLNNLSLSFLYYSIPGSSLRPWPGQWLNTSRMATE